MVLHNFESIFFKQKTSRNGQIHRLLLCKRRKDISRQLTKTFKNIPANNAEFRIHKNHIAQRKTITASAIETHKVVDGSSVPQYAVGNYE